jgi:hypothetical protein
MLEPKGLSLATPSIKDINWHDTHTSTGRVFSLVVNVGNEGTRNRPAMHAVNAVAITGHSSKAKYRPSLRTPLKESFLLSVATGLHGYKRRPSRSGRKRHFTARWRTVLLGPQAKRDVKCNWPASCDRLGIFELPA